MTPQIALFPLGKGFSPSGTGSDLVAREQTLAFLMQQFGLQVHNTADRSRSPYYFAGPSTDSINIVVPQGTIGAGSRIAQWMFLGKWNGKGFVPVLWVHLNQQHTAEFCTQKVPVGPGIGEMLFTVGKQYSPSGKGNDLVDQNQTLQKLAELHFQIHEGSRLMIPQSTLPQIWVKQAPNAIWGHSASPNWDIVCRWSQSQNCYIPVLSVYHPDITHQFFTAGIPSGVGIIP